MPQSRPLRLRRLAALAIPPALGVLFAACSGSSDYGGGMLGLFEPAAYLAIGGDASGCPRAYSIDGAPYVAMTGDVALEIAPGPHTVRLSAGSLSSDCYCDFGSRNECQFTSRKGHLTRIHMRAEYGDVCACFLIFCLNNVNLTAECSP